MARTANAARESAAAPEDMPDFTRYRHPVMAVACADCGAKVGTFCRRPSGHKASEFHRSRKVSADAEFVRAHGVDAWIERLGNNGWRIHTQGRQDRLRVWKEGGDDGVQGTAEVRL